MRGVDIVYTWCKMRQICAGFPPGLARARMPAMIRTAIVGLVLGACALLAPCCAEAPSAVAPAEEPAVESPSSPAPEPALEPPSPPAFLGEWFSCDRRLEFRPDGTWREEDMIARCGFDGSWRFESGDLLRTLDRTDWRFEGDQALLETPLGPMPAAMPAVERGPDRLFLVDREAIRTRLYFGPEVRRQTWRFVGRAESAPEREREMRLRVVGEPENGFFLGSFWSPNRDCGAFFSCGGRINTFILNGDRLSATASAHGECAISGTLDGTRQPDGSYQGTFTSITCGRLERGTFTAALLEGGDSP